MWYSTIQGVYLYSFVDESSSEPSRLQVRILFSRSHTNLPHFRPRIVKRFMHGIHAWVMWSNHVRQVHGNAVFLEKQRFRLTSQKKRKMAHICGSLYDARFFLFDLWPKRLGHNSVRNLHCTVRTEIFIISLLCVWRVRDDFYLCGTASNFWRTLKAKQVN